MAPKKKSSDSARKVKDLKPKAQDVKGGKSAAQKRLEDQRNSLQRNWAG